MKAVLPERTVEGHVSIMNERTLPEPFPKITFLKGSPIATEKPGRLCDSKFLFSAIHLAKQARSIERLGYSVALAKVPLGQA